jgi:DNA primase
MSGIDFNRLRHEITMAQVLDLLGFECTRRRRDQWYGYCPLHECEPKHRRAFSVNVTIGCYYCHKCGSRGDQFTLWAEATQTPIRQATINLCRQLRQDVPWIRRS